MRSPLALVIDARLSAFGDDPAFTFVRRIGDDRISHLSGRDLLARGAALADSLRAATGLSAPRIVLVMPPGAAFVTGLFTGLLHGLTIIPVAAPRRGPQAERFRHIVQNSGADVVLCLPQDAEGLCRHLADTPEARLPCPVAALTEGITLRHLVVREFDYANRSVRDDGSDVPSTLLGVCVEALVDLFFEDVDSSGSSDS